MPVHLDEIDIKILQHLQKRARISNVELADLVGLSPAPCLRRVRALEEAGVIREYVALVAPAQLNLGVIVFVRITLDLQVEGRLEIFEKAIMQRPEVLECYLTTGDADYLLRAVVADVAAYEQFLRDFLTRIESVAGIKSSFALKQVKYLTALPLPSTAPQPKTWDEGTNAPQMAPERGARHRRPLRNVGPGRKTRARR